jgi:hypothetical protein
VIGEKEKGEREEVLKFKSSFWDESCLRSNLVGLSPYSFIFQESLSFLCESLIFLQKEEK